MQAAAGLVPSSDGGIAVPSSQLSQDACEVGFQAWCCLVSVLVNDSVACMKHTWQVGDEHFE